MKAFHFHFFTLILLISSCSGDKLTSSKALELLNKDYNDDCYAEILHYYDKRYPERYLNQIRAMQKFSRIWNHQQIMAKFSELEDMGLVTVERQGDRITQITGTTGQMKKIYNKNHFKVLTSQVTEVLGVSQEDDSNTASVRFKITYNQTPFYEMGYAKTSCPSIGQE